MRVAVVGSRRYPNKDVVEALVRSFKEGTVVVSGGAKGVDTWAADAARARGLEVVVHLPEIEKGMPYFARVKAYYARNLKIVEDVERVYAFVMPDRKGGTENTIKHAIRLKLPLILIYPTEAGVPEGVIR